MFPFPNKSFLCPQNSSKCSLNQGLIRFLTLATPTVAATASRKEGKE